jgi:hypothetical protein
MTEVMYESRMTEVRKCMTEARIVQKMTWSKPVDTPSTLLPFLVLFLLEPRSAGGSDKPSKTNYDDSNTSARAYHNDDR